MVLLKLLPLMVLAISCGKKSKGNKGGGGPSSEVERSLSLAASENGIPQRYILAAGLLESNLAPNKSSVFYADTNSEEIRKKLGFHIGETAFGISRSTLGLDSVEKPDDLSEQIRAYGKWVAASLKEADQQLSTNPQKIEEKFQWIWELAKLHRQGKEDRRNIRVIWALEFINILNTGAIWQDPKNGKQIKLDAANPPLKLADFPPDARRLLSIFDESAEVSAARRISLSRNTNTAKNRPQRIEVIHCPFNLSACLEVQDDSVSSDVRLGAHFVIPQDNTVISRAIQILDHDWRVALTDSDGSKREVADAIIIMLVGNSGRYVESVRKNANPTWFKSTQLRRLGNLVSSLCSFLDNRYESINYKTCSAPEEKNGVLFHNQGTRPTYRWGDIPDFEKSIFHPYLSSSDNNIAGETVFEYPNNNKTFNAGQNIEVIASFQSGVRFIELQRAIRCDDGQVVWTTVQSKQIRGREIKQSLQFSVLDAGPNSNGQQFLRLLVYGEESVGLMGWAIDDFFLSGFDPKFRPPSRECQFRSKF